MLQEEFVTKVETAIAEQISLNFELTEPELNCNSSNRIQRVCIHVECQKQALICDQRQCQKCGKQQHMFCPSVKFSSLTYLLEQRMKKQQQFYQKACEIERSLNLLIRQSVQKLTKIYSYGQLNQKYLEIINEIYVKHNANCMVSRQAEDLWRRLLRQGETEQEQSEVLLLNFRNSTKAFTELVLDPINRNLKLQKEGGCGIQSQFKINSEVITSSIVKNEEKRGSSLLQLQSNYFLVEEQFKFLISSLGNPKQFVLLYRGSRDGFAAADFHKKCDNISNTLVLVRTQFGKTIAGFTESPWNAVANNYVHGANKKCCLISLDLKEKMVPNEATYLIYCHPNYGPTFGKYSHDLFIADQCNNNRTSHANFPHCYNKEGETKYKNQQATVHKFIGASSGCYFRVLDYEVFKVVF